MLSHILRKNNLNYFLSISKYLILFSISFTLILSSFSFEASATHPNAPGNFRATAVSPTQIDLLWSAPSSSNPITGYKIMYVVDNGLFEELVSNTGTTTTKYSHKNLVKDHVYFYRVYAISSSGLGEPSVIRSATTLQGTSVPTAPTSLVANTVSPSSIFLTWKAPQNDGGSPIIGYKIEYSTTNTWRTLVSNTGTPQTSFYHVGIGSGINYNYRVSAINSNGDGNPSNITSIIPELTTKPGITGITVGPTQVRLSWTAPSYTYGQQIIGYEIDKKVGDTYVKVVENTGLTTSYTVSGLETDEPYTFRVAALFLGSTQSVPSSDITVIPTDLFSPPSRINLPPGTSIYLHEQSPGSFSTVTFSDPGPQAYHFSSPSDKVTGIWATVSTYVSGAVLYFDLNGNTYSMKIDPSSRTLISFSSPMSISNVRMSITDRVYSSDVGSVAYQNIASQPTIINYLPTGTIVNTSQQSPGSLNTVRFSDPGPQTQYFSSPSDKVTGIWATVSTYVSGAVLYFDLNGNTYSMNIDPSSRTLISFSSPMSISNVRMSIDYRGYSSDVGSVSYAKSLVQSSSVPDAPRSLYATVNQQNNVELSWTSPPNVGKPSISGYQIEYKKSPSDTWNVLSKNIGLSTIYVQPELSENTSYSFRVSAINRIGTSQASNVASVTTGSFITPPQTNAVITSGIIPVFNTDKQLSYVISGGRVFGTAVNIDATSLDILLKGNTAGVLYIQLPRTLIDSKQSDTSDKDFFVTVDDKNAEFTETRTGEYRTLAISFPANADKISVMGTFVVPEFGTIAAIVLGVSILSIVIFTTKNKVSFSSLTHNERRNDPVRN